MPIINKVFTDCRVAANKIVFKELKFIKSIIQGKNINLETFGKTNY